MVMQLTGMEHAAAVEADGDLIKALKSAVAQVYFAAADKEWLASDEAGAGIQYEAVYRYVTACRYAVPWADKYCGGLADKDVVDIGAGTGATTAAFARVARSVRAYEIQQNSVDCCAERFRLLDVRNARMELVEPTNLLGRVVADHPEGCDVILLFAVVEHLTQAERLEYLQTLWGLLKPGGHFIIADTPNRLGLLDRHTSDLPFFHLLPVEVALRYYHKALRREFVAGIDAQPDTAAKAEQLHRWGLGVSYHDFEISFGEGALDEFLTANGFEFEPINWFAPNLEDRVMTNYFLELGISHVNIGYARPALNLIFRKPDESRPTPPRRILEASWIEMIVDYHKLDPRMKARLARD